MEIIYKSLKELKPYENNPRRNDRAVSALAESIQEYGFKVPCVIDQNGVLITGHTRYKAAKKLGLKEIPCIIAEDLTPEQIDEFRIADNKVGEISQWDKKKLSFEMAKLPKFEPLKLGFRSNDLAALHKTASGLAHIENKNATIERRANILNLEIEEFLGVGEWDIPEIYPVYEVPEITEWIGFNYVLSDKDPDEEKAHKGVHFFIDDYQFERVWNKPDLYIDALQKYGAVLSPDFSPYADMPMATQLFNHYRKHWVGAYWQANNITVIPTIRGSADERGRAFWLDGEPVGGIVAISTMWDSDEWLHETAKWEYNEMCKRLKPCKIYVYGKKPDYIRHKNIEIVDTFTQKRYGNGERQ